MFILKKNRKLSLIIICLATLLLVTACDRRVMWYSTESFKHTEARYRFFDGTEEKFFNADAGETIVFEYVSEVKEGSLEIKLYGPNDVELLTIPTNTAGTKSLQIETSGRYRLKFYGVGTKGSYDISWKVK